MDNSTDTPTLGDVWAWSQLNDAMDICYSDEEEEVVATSSRSRTHKDHDQTSRMYIDSHGAKAHDLQHTRRRASAHTGLVIHKVAESFIAQGLSPSWQPGPCRSPTPPSHTPSPAASPSNTASIMCLPKSYWMPREQQPDNLPTTNSWLFKGIKANIGTLPLSEIAHSPNAISSRKHIQVIAEYTWIQITKGQQMANVLFPAVYSPGQPRVWQGIATPSQSLEAASEPPAIIDEHPQRQQSFPYEPTFKVLQTLHEQQSSTPSSNPTTNFRHVDIVCDAATLATLFQFLEDPDPAKRIAFRLELATVRNTLFITTATHRGRGYTDKGGRGPIPAWVGPALTTLGTGGHATGPLFLSGNHFRIVRYRLGSLVLVVRAKVDFALENRAPLPRNENPPFRGCKYERYHTTDEEGKQHVLGFQTLVKQGEGRGTRPDAAGLTSVRFAKWDCKTTLTAKMPLLWFGRTPFILDGVVSRDFRVMETKLYCARESYAGWEKQHQTGLKLMAGALEQLQGITRAAGGNCIVIADPGERGFRIHRPVIKRFPIPESLALAVWGPDEDPAETDYESSMESNEDSALSQLSGTPSGFSGWELEGEKIPEVHDYEPRWKGRHVVENWLDDDEENISSEEDDDGYRRASVTKKQARILARNPVVQHMSSTGPRKPKRPAGYMMGNMYDGAADYNTDYNADVEDEIDDEEEEMTDFEEEADVTTLVGDSDWEDQASKGNLDDENGQDVLMSEEAEDHDGVEDVGDEDYVSSIEFEEVSL